MAGRADVERTEDGRFLVIDGRRWRATDPLIPEERRAELQRVLMAWRREVKRTKGTDEERHVARRGAGREGRARRARHALVGADRGRAPCAVGGRGPHAGAR